jgi:hypothetical protein
MNIARKIIDEVADKMLDNRILLEDIAIVPNVFLIYLHRDNHPDIKFYLKTLRDQIIVRLNKEVKKRNDRKTKDLGKLKKMIDLIVGSEVAGREYKIIMPDDWDISFQATDRDVLVGDKVFQIQKNEICVVASFSEESGHTDSLDSQLKTFVTIFKSEDKKAENHIVETARPLERNFEQLINQFEETPANPNLLALLSCKYIGEESVETFEMIKDRIVVGRDPDADFVLLRASDKISRKHFEISFRDGRFFLRNFGIYGTMLDGKTVPLSEKIVNNTTQELDKELEITALEARLALAGGEVLINFKRMVQK